MRFFAYCGVSKRELTPALTPPNMTNKTTMNAKEIEKEALDDLLKEGYPHIALTISYSSESEGKIATVEAHTIIKGEMFRSSKSREIKEPCPMLNGQYPEMARDVIKDLLARIS